MGTWRRRMFRLQPARVLRRLSAESAESAESSTRPRCEVRPRRTTALAERVRGGPKTGERMVRQVRVAGDSGSRR